MSGTSRRKGTIIYWADYNSVCVVYARRKVRAGGTLVKICFCGLVFFPMLSTLMLMLTIRRLLMQEMSGVMQRNAISATAAALSGRENGVIDRVRRIVVRCACAERFRRHRRTKTSQRLVCSSVRCRSPSNRVGHLASRSATIRHSARKQLWLRIDQARKQRLKRGRKRCDVTSKQPKPNFLAYRKQEVRLSQRNRA